MSAEHGRSAALVDAISRSDSSAAWARLVSTAISIGERTDSDNLLVASVAALRNEILPTVDAGSKFDHATAYAMAMDPYELPPIYVIVSPSAFIIDTYSAWSEAKRRFDYKTTPKVTYEYTGEECTEASEFYLAHYEILESMSDLGTFMGAMANSLEPLACDTVPGKPLCVDLFIANARSLVFGGDDREFDPEAGIDESRVHLYIDPETLESDVEINTSRMNVHGVVLVDSMSLFDPDQDIEILPMPGGFMVKATFFNNFCAYRSTCPTIDLELFFNEDSSEPGGYDVYWVRHGFPSMGIYMRSDDNQSWHTLAEDPERIKSAWLNWLALKDGFLQSVNLPPGCNVQ